MTKSKTQTREDLMEQLQALERADEVAALKTDNERLQDLVHDLTHQRDTETRRNKELQETLTVIYQAMRPIIPSIEGGRAQLSRGRIHAAVETPNAPEATTAVQMSEPKPHSRLTEASLESIFPELSD